MSNQPKPSQIVIMVSGFVALITLFLNWYTSDFTGDQGVFSTDIGMFPLATYIPLIGIAMGVIAALRAFSNVRFPEQVLGFSWNQINLILAVFAGLLAIGFLIQSLEGFDKAIGLWLGFLAAAGLVAGAVMDHVQGEQATDAPSGAPPTPF